MENKIKPIKRKKGGQPKNKNAEKWTEKKALKLGEELMEWFLPKTIKTDDGRNVDIHAMNLFYKDFLLLKKRLPPDLIKYLEKKFNSFADIIKGAKEIQEIKMMKRATMSHVNTTFAIFYLKAKLGWKETNVVEMDVDIIIPKELQL